MECVSSQYHASAASRKMSSQFYESEEPNIPTSFRSYQIHVDSLPRTYTVPLRHRRLINSCLISFLQARSQSITPVVKSGLNSACTGVSLTFIWRNKTVNSVFLDLLQPYFKLIISFYISMTIEIVPSLKHYVPRKSFTIAWVRGSAVGRGTELQAGTWRVQLPMASFQSHYGAGFVSASNRNE
jgi:hypothetical protein